MVDREIPNKIRMIYKGTLIDGNCTKPSYTNFGHLGPMIPRSMSYAMSLSQNAAILQHVSRFISFLNGAQTSTEVNPEQLKQ